MKSISFFIIITISGAIFTTQILAQSLFSGLILSERKDGLMVVDAQPGSPAFDAGLKTGDLVLEIDGKKINSLEDYVIISRNAKSKKVESSLIVRREGILYEAIIRIYSIPINQQWEQKVTKPQTLPKGLTNSPFEYWISKGKMAFKKLGKTVPFEKMVKNYNEVIKCFFNALHYQTESIDTALLIAKLYHELGNLYLKNENINEGIKYYKHSINLNTRCLKKTKKEYHLNIILVNLQEIEEGLSKIEMEKASNSSTP